MPKDQIYISAQVENGVAKWTDEQREIMRKSIASLDGKRVRIWIEEEKNRRSIEHNSYYWVILTYIQDETGNDKNFLHDFFRRKYLPIKEVEAFGKRFESLTSTTELSVGEMMEYTDKIKIFAAEWGITLPERDQIRG